MTQEMAPEMEALKARLKATWMSGDYGTFAKYLEPGALEFLERLRVEPGTGPRRGHARRQGLGPVRRRHPQPLRRADNVRHGGRGACRGRPGTRQRGHAYGPGQRRGGERPRRRQARRRGAGRAAGEPCGHAAAGDIQDPLATPETTDTWAFLGGSGAVPQVTTSAGQRIVVQSTAAMGTTVDGGAGDLKLDLCYKSTAADSAVRDLPGGAHVFDVTLLKNQRMPFSLSWTATLPAGTYQVGICYGLINLDSAAGWNANDWTRNMVQVYNQ